MQQRTIKVIPATHPTVSGEHQSSNAKRRVAGYARVSTDKDDQFTSYEAQIDYYTNYIKSRPDWQFVKVYTDEGITGTSTKRREGFKSMIKDALDGKIDLIITKSVSRFARNTVDSLTTIRKLKEKRIECFFEKENIWTFDGKGELLITIMSSLAQEEARSISENCTWGQRKRFADGKVSVAFGRFLGYDRGENGEFVVNREQAETVKKIYRMYLDGYGTTEIARQLTEENILSPGGKSAWNASSVLSILRNEKYKGDALLQKSYTSDFLTKKHLKNNGEVQQYYVTANHEPIVSPEVFEMVQAEIKLRKGGHGRLDDDLLFKGKLKCAVCGGTFSRFVWHSNTTHRKYIWHCTERYMGKKAGCSSGNFSEDELKVIILAEINKIITPDYKGVLEITNKEAFNTTELEQKASALTDELTSLSAEIDRLSARNARTEANLSQELSELEDRYNEKRSEYNNVVAEIDDKKTRAVIAEKFLKDLSEIKEPLKEWDDEVFRKLVDRVEIKSSKDVNVIFKSS